MAFGPIKKPSEIAIEIARECAIEKSKQASIRGADEPPNIAKEKGRNLLYGRQ